MLTEVVRLRRPDDNTKYGPQDIERLAEEAMKHPEIRDALERQRKSWQ